MKMLATAQGTTTAKPETIFNLWMDVEQWPEWDKEVAWVKLDGHHRMGARGVMKPVNGPKVKFTIIEHTLNQSFSDESYLPGAKLCFNHQLERTGGQTQVTHVVTISGPLSFFWSKILGANLRKGLQPAVDQLIKKAEAA